MSGDHALPDDVDGAAILSTLETLPADLRESVWAVAVARWFDADIVAVLRPDAGADAETLYRSLQALPFVRAHPGGGHAIAAPIRERLLADLWAKRRETYVGWSKRLADHFGGILVGHARAVGPLAGLLAQPLVRSAHAWLRRRRHSGYVRSSSAALHLRIEQIYHAIVARQTWARDTIASQGLGWLSEFEPDLTALEALADAIGEHSRAGRTKENVRHWGAFYRATLAHNACDYDKTKRLLIRVVSRTGDDWLRANAAFSLAMLHRETWAFGKARPAVRLALSYYQAWNNAAGQANCHWLLGYIELLDNHFDAARKSVLRAMSLLRRPSHDVNSRANCYWTLGEIEAERQSVESARAYYDTARSLYGSVGSRVGVSNCMNSLGWLALLRGRPAEAFGWFTESLTLAEAIRARLPVANVVLDLGRAHEGLREFDAAADRFRQAANLQHSAQNPIGEANALVGVGRVEWQRRRLADAREAVEAGVVLHRIVGRRRSLGLGLGQAAEIQAAHDSWSEAIRTLGEAVQLAADGGEAVLESQLHRRLARLHSDRSDLDLAEEALRSADACLPDATDYPLSRAANQACAVDLAIAHGDLLKAREHVATAARLFGEAGWTLRESWQALQLGELAALAGDYAAAQTSLHEALRLATDADHRTQRLACLASLALFHALNNDNDAALKHFNEAIEAQAYPPTALLLGRACQHGRMGDHEAMARDLEVAAAAGAAGSTLAHGHGRLALLTGDLDAARARFTAALEAWPKSLVAHVALGSAHLAAGHAEDALALVRRGLAVDGSHPSYGIYVELMLDVRSLEARSDPYAPVAREMARLIAGRIYLSPAPA